jgi:asparagine synthase (glutamine-hydrolysing)
VTLCYYEGYIRNRRQLCRDLDLPDGTNEQAILEAAYRRWGADLVHHLYGAFAFAFHDKDDNSYFCARDQIGVQPFFITKPEITRSCSQGTSTKSFATPVFIQRSTWKPCKTT